MTDTTFTDYTTTVTAAWLNDINDAVYTGLGGATTVAGVKTTLSISNFTYDNTGLSSGKYLVYNGTNWAPTTLSITTSNISDFNISSPTNNQVLRYNSGTSKWVNNTLTLDSLSQVSISLPASGEFLKYNGSNWVNSTISISNVSEAGAIGIGRNFLINGTMAVRQRSNVTLSTSYQYGMVDMWLGKVVGGGGDPTAGTLTQYTGQHTGAINKNSLHFLGVSSANSGSIIYAETRLADRHAAALMNSTVSFSCKVLHDMGSSKNFTIVIKKANSTNNFSATTTIGTSSSQGVSNNTLTTISYEGLNLGNCSTGLAIEIQCACGTITTKNVYITDAQLTISSTAPTYCPVPFELEHIQCLAYCCKSYAHSTTKATATNAGIIFFEGYSATTAPLSIGVQFRVPMVQTPTVTLYDTAGNSGKTDRGGTNSTGSATQISGAGFLVYNSTTTSSTYLGSHFFADSGI